MRDKVGDTVSNSRIKRLTLGLIVLFTLQACSTTIPVKELDAADLAALSKSASVIAMITDHPILFSNLDNRTMSVPKSCFSLTRFQIGPNPPLRLSDYNITYFVLQPGSYLVGNWDESVNRDHTMAGDQDWFIVNLLPGARLFIGKSLETSIQLPISTSKKSRLQAMFDLGFSSYTLLPYPSRHVAYPNCGFNL